jgi:hypothetical protein
LKLAKTFMSKADNKSNPKRKKCDAALEELEGKGLEWMMIKADVKDSTQMSALCEVLTAHLSRVQAQEQDIQSIESILFSLQLDGDSAGIADFIHDLSSNPLNSRLKTKFDQRYHHPRDVDNATTQSRTTLTELLFALIHFDFDTCDPCVLQMIISTLFSKLNTTQINSLKNCTVFCDAVASFMVRVVDGAIDELTDEVKTYVESLPSDTADTDPSPEINTTLKIPLEGARQPTAMVLDKMLQTGGTWSRVLFAFLDGIACRSESEFHLGRPLAGVAASGDFG